MNNCHSYQIQIFLSKGVVNAKAWSVFLDSIFVAFPQSALMQQELEFGSVYLAILERQTDEKFTVLFEQQDF